MLGRFAAVAARAGETAEHERIGRAALESGAYLKGESEALLAAGLQTTLAQLAAAEPRALRQHAGAAAARA